MMGRSECVIIMIIVFTVALSSENSISHILGDQR